MALIKRVESSTSYTVSIQPTGNGKAPGKCGDLDEQRLSVEAYKDSDPGTKTTMTNTEGAVLLYPGDRITFQYSDAAGSGWWNDLTFSGLWFAWGADVSLLRVDAGTENTSYSNNCYLEWGSQDVFFEADNNTLKFTVVGNPPKQTDLQFLIVGGYKSSSWCYDPEMCVDPLTSTPLGQFRGLRIHVLPSSRQG